MTYELVLSLPTKPSLIALSILCLSTMARMAFAAYPDKPIRIIVPYPAGSAPDFTAREVGQLYTKALSQPIVIDTRPGAAATLGHAIAAKSNPDGYTLLLATTGGMVSGPALLGHKIPYDASKDFAPIGLATYVPYGLAVTSGLPALSIKELITLAKTVPGKLNVASPGVGTPNHLGAAQLMTMTGIELTHVPYKGGSLALNDLIAGNVQILVTALMQLIPLHQTGRVRILGIGHQSRLKAYPDIPTIAETVPGYYNTGWWGIVAPAGLEPAIVRKLNTIMQEGLVNPEVVKRFEKNGLEVTRSTAPAMQALITSDLQLWKKLIKDAKISVDVLP